MSGTSEGGRKAAAKTRQKYGADAPAKWGRAGAYSRVNRVGGLNKPDKVKEIASLGGKSGYRTRKITIDGKLKPEEWGILIKTVNSAAGRLRLEGNDKYDAMEQCLVYHEMFEYWSKENWYEAIRKIHSEPDLDIVFAEMLNEMVNYYNKIIVDQPRRSEDREIACTYRNLLAAYNLALKEMENEDSARH